MAVREFVGMRVVPILGRIGDESIIWDGGEYEPLTIVMTEGGDTYMSRCMVPYGTDVNNKHYWAKFANFNAQLALLQQTVETCNTQINGVVDSLGYAYDDTNTVYNMIQSRGINNTVIDNEYVASIYIAGVTGLDTNGGTSDTDAVKTLDRALELAKEHNWSNVYLRFRESATYTCSRSIFSNSTIHWSAGSLANNVIVRFTDPCNVYNSYWNIETNIGNVLRLDFESGWNVDHSSIYASHAQFNIATTYSFNASEIVWTDVTITTTEPMRNVNCFIKINGITFNYNGSGIVMYAENSQIQIFSNAINVNTISQSTNAAFRLDQCFVTILSNILQSGPKFATGIHLVHSILFTSTTAQTTFANLVSDAANALTGTNAVYKVTNTLTELT